MNQGWISIYRGITDHWLWNEDKPFDKRSAWIDLLLLANHRNLKVLQKGKLVERKRGEVNMSMVQLADRWGWDRRTVKKYLKMLEGDGMISVACTADGTTVTIENYSKYQDVVPSECTGDGTTPCTTGSTGVCTTGSTTPCTTPCTHDNNDKQCNNNDKQKERERFTPPSLSEVEAYIREKGYHINAQSFVGFYESKGWMIGKNKMRNWHGAIATWEQRWKEERGNGTDNGAGDKKRGGIRTGVSGRESDLGGDPIKLPPIYFNREEDGV